MREGAGRFGVDDMSEKKAKAKKRRVGTGKIPPGVLAEWNLRGYVSPTQAAEIKGVARSTVYGWTERDALQDPEGRDPAVVKRGAFKWLLRRAVEALGGPGDVGEALAEG